MTLKARAASDADWTQIAALRNRIKHHAMFCAVDRPTVAAADLKAMLAGCFTYIVEDVPVSGKSTIIGFAVDRAPAVSDDQHVDLLYCLVDYDRPDAQEASKILIGFGVRSGIARGFKKAVLGIETRFLPSLAFMEAGVVPRASEIVEGTDPTTGKAISKRIEYVLADLAKAMA